MPAVVSLRDCYAGAAHYLSPQTRDFFVVAHFLFFFQILIAQCSEVASERQALQADLQAARTEVRMSGPRARH